MSTIFSLALFLGLSSCSKFLDKFGRLNQGESQVTFSRSRVGLVGPLGASGGLMIYMERNDGLKKSISLANEFVPASATIPNGLYTFRAYGWNATDMTGAPRCALTGTVSLEGQPETVDLTMSMENCFSDPGVAPAFASDGTTMSPLQFVFCNHFSDLSVLSDLDDCQNGLESSYFVSGNGNGTYDPASNTAFSIFADYSQSRNLALFTSTIQVDGSAEVYVSDLATGLQRKISKPANGTFGGAINNSNSNDRPRFLGSGSKVLYISDLETLGHWDLYLTDIDTHETQCISCNVAGQISAVKDFQISEDNAFVVFAASNTATTAAELYAADLSVSSPVAVKISGSLAGDATGVANCSSACEYLYALSPTLSAFPFVVYAADEAGSASPPKVHITSLPANSFAGGTADFEVISGAELSSSSDTIDRLAVSFDGRHVVYHSNTPGFSNTADRIYDKPIPDLSVDPVSGTTSVEVTSVIGDATLVAGTKFALAHSSGKIAFGGFDYNECGASEPRCRLIYIYDLDTQSPPAITAETFQFLAKFSGDLFKSFEFSPDDFYVVATSGSSSDVNMLVNTSMSGSSHGAITAFDQLLTAGTNSKRYFKYSPDNTTLVYAMNDVASGPTNIYYSDLGSDTPNLIGTGDTTNQILGYGVASDSSVYYLQDSDSNATVQILKTSMTASPTPSDIGSEALMGGLLEIYDAPSSNPAVFFQAANLQSPSAVEIFSHEPANSEPTKRLAKVAEDSLGIGLGRVRLSLLEYGLSRGTGIADASPAFTGPCMDNDNVTADGTAFVTSQIPPYGDSGSELFAIKVEVFPLASDCDGTPVTYQFPLGLANYSSSPGAAQSKLVGDAAGTLKLFLRDQ